MDRQFIHCLDVSARELRDLHDPERSFWVDIHLPQLGFRPCLRLVFAGHPLQTNVLRIHDVQNRRYRLLSNVPLADPSMTTADIKVEALDQDGHIIGVAPCGTFSYSPCVPSLKRRRSEYDEPDHHSGGTADPAELAFYPPELFHSSPTSAPSTPSDTASPPDWSALPGPPSPHVITSPSNEHTELPAYDDERQTKRLKLLRTTQAPASVSPTSAPRLVINGDLASMAERWTPEEYHCGRRLVQFWSRLTGSDLHVAFAPVHPEDFKQEEEGGRAIVVSCIFHEEANECYLTSVDALCLLENLLGYQFNLEEKNRVRRNLEGFKPQTIGKARPSMESFFQQIMNYTAPKPRNIEKKLKVFKWADLPAAFERILAKYALYRQKDLAAPAPSPSLPVARARRKPPPSAPCSPARAVHTRTRRNAGVTHSRVLRFTANLSGAKPEVPPPAADVDPDSDSTCSAIPTGTPNASTPQFLDDSGSTRDSEVASQPAGHGLVTFSPVLSQSSRDEHAFVLPNADNLADVESASQLPTSLQTLPTHLSQADVSLDEASMQKAQPEHSDYFALPSGIRGRTGSLELFNLMTGGQSMAFLDDPEESIVESPRLQHAAAARPFDSYDGPAIGVQLGLSAPYTLDISSMFGSSLIVQSPTSVHSFSPSSSQFSPSSVSDTESAWNSVTLSSAPPACAPYNLPLHETQPWLQELLNATPDHQ